MKYLIIGLLGPSLLFAQKNISGVITNAGGAPLPLTNIVSLNRQIGTVTNEQGEFSLIGIPAGDSIKISNIAYHSKCLAIQELSKQDTLVLDENIKELRPVAVKNLSAYRESTSLGYGKYTDNGAFRLGPGNQLALYIPNKLGKTALIASMSFQIKQFGKCNNSIRVRVLQMDTLQGRPADDLLDENIVIASDELKRHNIIDLRPYQLIFPGEGICIVLEWVAPDKSCDKNSYSVIAANLQEPRNIVWLNFRDRAWSKKDTPRLPNGNYLTPNIGVQVLY